MIPSYESMAKQAIVRVFNTIMTRAGITLIVTVAFSISSMFYNISKDYPFFYGGVLTDSVFRRYLYQVRRLNEYVLFERWRQSKHGTQDIPQTISVYAT